jgi:hypothetical protein
MNPWRSVGIGLVLTIGLAVSGRAQDRPDPITLTARCQSLQRLTLTLANTSASDTAIVIGTVLANGQKYLIDRLTLRATTQDGKREQYEYRPRDYPGVIAGRVDDWILALPARSSFVLPVEPPRRPS